MEEKNEVGMEMEMERIPDSHDHEMVEAKVYPSPLYTHEEVVRDREAFMVALRRFLSSIGSNFTIPVVGGKELDLHLLYVEVTRRGGLEKVIKERKWRDIIAEFKFPRTTTSAAYVLRKYYLSLLHHFEQLYFFGANGPMAPPSASLQTKTPQSKLNKAGSAVSGSSTENSDAQERVLPETLNEGSLNFNVTGLIDGKFEYGYLVTVKIGDELLRGILYNVPQPQVSPYPSKMGAFMGATCANNVPTSAQMKGGRKRRFKRRDPAHPKPNRSAYNFFFAETHAKLREMYPERDREYSKMIGESWNKLTTEEKLVYHNYGTWDKERYKREMQEYREKLKLAPCTNETAGTAQASKNLPAKA
ncbi:High mobility group family [Rhynchospora pubera]|uniref:High mobility group family n=1 Tax=Rhynchospora pubera TaxID=906938 RepID=A0AAV8E5V0_9POAL|nr:High mobility group family [Rhynchospora pubera]